METARRFWRPIIGMLSRGTHAYPDAHGSTSPIATNHCRTQLDRRAAAVMQVCAPSRKTCMVHRVSFDGVEPPIARVDVQAPTGEYRGSTDGRSEGESPQEFSMCTVQRIEQAVIGTKVDP